MITLKVNGRPVASIDAGGLEYAVAHCEYREDRRRFPHGFLSRALSLGASSEVLVLNLGMPGDTARSTSFMIRESLRAARAALDEVCESLRGRAVIYVLMQSPFESKMVKGIHEDDVLELVGTDNETGDVDEAATS